MNAGKPETMAESTKPVMNAQETEETLSEESSAITRPDLVVVCHRTKQLVIKVPLRNFEGVKPETTLPAETLFQINKLSFRRDWSGRASLNFSGASTTFPFLRLPAELRNIVYEHVLILGSPGESISLKITRATDTVAWIRYRPPYWRHFSVADDDVHVTALLRVNRQLHQEGLAFVYGRNPFDFTQANVMIRFIENGPSILAYLKKVTIKNMASSGKKARSDVLHLLKDAQCLTELCIESVGPLGQKTISDWVLREFRNLKPVITRLMSNHDGDLDRAVKAIQLQTCGCGHCASWEPCGVQKLMKTQYRRSEKEQEEKKKNQKKKRAERRSSLRPRKRT